MCSRSREKVREARALRGCDPNRHSLSYAFAWVEVSLLSLGLSLIFARVEVVALRFEGGLGLVPCCLILWSLSGLPPLSGAGLFAIVGGRVSAIVARSPGVSITSRAEVLVHFIFRGGGERCPEALLIEELEVSARID